MSLIEEQQGNRPPSREEAKAEDQEEEKGMDEDTPLVAVAPNASFIEELPSVATDVPAFQCLDELLSLGKISKTKLASMKSSYRQLQDALKSTQNSELQLLGEAKRYRAELERLQAEVERREEESISEQPTGEVNELRQQLLQAYSELKAAEDREYKTQHKLKCLWEEKRCLERDNETQPEPAELESRTKQLQDIYEDLKKEVAQRQVEVRSLTEDVETHETQILKEQKELEDIKKIIELREAEKAQLISIPEQISKAIERKRSKREAATKKIETINTEISEMERQAKEAEERNRSLESKKKELTKELDGIKAQVEAVQREGRQLLKNQEVTREEEVEITGTRSVLQMKLQNIMCDRKHLHESQSVQLREKNRQMQALKKTECALALSAEQLQQMQFAFNKLQTQFDAVPKREAGAQQRMELQKEVVALKVSIAKQLSVAEAENQKKQHHRVIQDLLRESNCLREELHNLRCLTQIKAEERGQKHRDLLRAEQMNQNIQQELREKSLINMDHNKLNATLQRRISQYGVLYDVIAKEKNKYDRLNQISSQTITELKEQVKVLENEAEIQHSIVINKDRLLTKARMKVADSCNVRDKLRNDMSKIAWKQRQISQEYEDNKLELMKLTQTSDLQEQALLEISKNHEMAVQRRNSLGIQLLEQEEVLFSYFEKVNSQEAAITRGNMMLEALEKEMRDLQLAVNEEKRRIDLKKKEVPVKRKLEGEIAMLQIELSEARDQTLEGLNGTADFKELKGTDPSTVELVEKIEQLEVNLAERERQLLEKELLVDQVIRLSKPLREQADNCQQDRLSLAKKVNELRAHIVDNGHRLMAVSAELSMKQATALSLQQEIKEKELQVERCQQRLEQGLPPCPEMEEEWRRMLRDKKRRQRDKEERERLAEEKEWNQLANGETTTAETRPNAYIPQTEQLPLPRPYGAQAPFKPSQPGANMRHIRKPALNL